MKLRCGRKQPRNIYLQLGETANDNDQLVGQLDSGRLGMYVVGVINEHRSPDADDSFLDVVAPLLKRDHI